MMRKTNLTMFLPLLLPVLLSSASAAELELEITLPDYTLLVPPISPPLLQREAQPLFSEQELITELLAALGSGEYQQALDLARERYEDILQLLEEGDPDNLLPRRAVPGGFQPGTRSNQISANMLLVIGHLYLSLDMPEAAERSFQTALVPLPDYMRVHEALGQLYVQNGDHVRAQQHISRAAELGLHTPALFGALGYLNQELNNFMGAVSAFQEALMLEPANPNWKQGLLYALAQSKQYQSAIALVDQLLQEEPDNAVLWLHRSQFTIASGDRNAALASLETAIRLGDDTYGNLQVCAALHMELGSIERAVQLLDEAFAKGMDYVYAEQAMRWLDQKQEWQYLQMLTAALRQQWQQLDELQRSALLTREASLSLQEDAQEQAREALQEAVELNPTNAEALMKLAGVYNDLGNLNRAELLYQRASAFPEYQENALISLAQIAVDQNSYERALQLLRQVLSVNPDRIDLRRNIEIIENLRTLQQQN